MQPHIDVHGRLVLPEIPEPGPDAHPIDKAMWAIADALNYPVSPDGTIYDLRFVDAVRVYDRLLSRTSHPQNIPAMAMVIHKRRSYPQVLATQLFCQSVELLFDAWVGMRSRIGTPFWGAWKRSRPRMPSSNSARWMP